MPKEQQQQQQQQQQGIIEAFKKLLQESRKKIKTRSESDADIGWYRLI